MKTRWRSVSVNDHSPSTRSSRAAAGSRPARAVVAAQSRSTVSHIARKSSALPIDRSWTRSGWRRSSSSATYAVTSTPLTTSRST